MIPADFDARVRRLFWTHVVMLVGAEIVFLGLAPALGQGRFVSPFQLLLPLGAQTYVVAASFAAWRSLIGERPRASRMFFALGIASSLFVAGSVALLAKVELAK